MAKKTRYILIDNKLGVFLGSYSMQDFVEPKAILEGKVNMLKEDPRSYALFAKHNPFGVTDAESFDSKEEAEQFIRDAFFDVKGVGLSAQPVDTDLDDPDLIDIIKAGYGDHTFDMLEGLETYNDTIH
jgi:hypothetical protein